jgi:hypothetical protein
MKHNNVLENVTAIHHVKFRSIQLTVKPKSLAFLLFYAWFSNFTKLQQEDINVKILIKNMIWNAMYNKSET